MTRRKRGTPGPGRRFGYKWEDEHALRVKEKYTVKKKVNGKLEDVEVVKVVKLSRLARAWKRQAEFMSDVQQDAGVDENVSDGVRWVNLMLKARDRARGTGKAQKSHDADYMVEWTLLENFILELYKTTPEQPDFAMVSKWAESWAPEFDRPISVETLNVYFNHLHEPTCNTLVMAAGLNGRGLDYESINKAKKVTKPPPTHRQSTLALIQSALRVRTARMLTQCTFR